MQCRRTPIPATANTHSLSHEWVPQAYEKWVTSCGGNRAHQKASGMKSATASRRRQARCNLMLACTRGSGCEISLTQAHSLYKLYTVLDRPLTGP